ncbi:MAG TPA: hypothetical protein PKA90_14340 [Ignavibacteria bacterium]|nr:hypothetical protein [Ignavibacteria bacterium]HMR41598.1 hypothetical protein [Ignavibacteria bacterium]
MKKIFKSILVILSFVAVMSFGSVNTSEAAVTSSSQITNNKCDITIVRTVENGVHYINVYINDSILVMKVEEL